MSLYRRKLRGWNKVDGYETHLPTNNRLIQSKNHRIYPLNKDYELIQKGEIVGNIQAMISGYIEHPYSNNEKFLNFYIIQIKTGENVKVDTELGNVYLGKTGDLKQTEFRNVTTDVLMSYYDTQTFMFVDFSNTKIDQDTVIKRFGKFSVK